MLYAIQAYEAQANEHTHTRGTRTGDLGVEHTGAHRRTRGIVVPEAERASMDEDGFTPVRRGKTAQRLSRKVPTL